MSSIRPAKLRFGPFELDVRLAELRNNGTRIRLPEQPFQILLMLLERQGDLVARDEIRARLWPDATVVEFDHSINSAVKRLRNTLRDTADQPRYIETLPRRGYRFIAQVEKEAPVVDGSGGAPLPMPPALDPPAPIPRDRHVRKWPAALAALIAGAGIWWLLNKSPAGKPLPDKPLAVIPLTTEPGIAMTPSFSPDGNQVAFQWDQNKREPRVFVRVIGPGEPVRLTTGATAEFGPAWSPDGRFIAFLRLLNESTYGVYLVPPLGGAERKLMEFTASPLYSPSFYGRFPGSEACLIAWTRDSKHLIISIPEASSSGLWLVSTDSLAKTRLTMPGAKLETS